MVLRRHHLLIEHSLCHSRQGELVNSNEGLHIQGKEEPLFFSCLGEKSVQAWMGVIAP